MMKIGRRRYRSCDDRMLRVREKRKGKDRIGDDRKIQGREGIKTFEAVQGMTIAKRKND